MKRTKLLRHLETPQQHNLIKKEYDSDIKRKKLVT